MNKLKLILAAASVAMLPFTVSATPHPLPPTPHSFVIFNGPFKGEQKVFFDVEHSSTTSFVGTIGKHKSPETVTITTNTAVHNGAGFAEINPLVRGSLTDIIIDPTNNFLWNDFTFRGQLDPLSLGNLSVIVTDQAGFTQTFAFSGLGQEDDFGRHGIISLDGETIDKIEMIGNFKELKQFEFSSAIAQAPDGGTTVMLLGAALTALGLVRRYLFA